MTMRNVSTMVAIDKIRVAYNDRRNFDDDALQSLAESMNSLGLVSPIVVRPVPTEFDGTNYELIAGERRLRAARALGWHTIAAQIVAMTDRTAADVMLVENVMRADLSPLEEAHAYQRRLDAGVSMAELITQTGVPKGRIMFRLELLRLIETAQEQLACGRLPMAWALSLSRVDAESQAIALEVWRNRDMTFNQWKDMLDDLREAREQEMLDVLADEMTHEEWTPTVRRLTPPSKQELVNMLHRVVMVLDSDGFTRLAVRDEAMSLLVRLNATEGM